MDAGLAFVSETDTDRRASESPSKHYGAVPAGLEEKELASRRGPREIDSGSIVRPIGLAPLAASLEQLAGILSEKPQEDAS